MPRSRMNIFCILVEKRWCCTVLLFLIFQISSWKYFDAIPRAYKSYTVRAELPCYYEKHLLLILEMSVMSVCRPGRLQRNNKHIIMRGELFCPWNTLYKRINILLNEYIFLNFIFSFVCMPRQRINSYKHCLM